MLKWKLPDRFTHFGQATAQVLSSMARGQICGSLKGECSVNGPLLHAEYGCPILTTLANSFLARQPDPRAIVWLFCLPYAGAGSSRYFRWNTHLPSTVDVCPVLLPGRESRLWEQPYSDLDKLVYDLCEALATTIDRPFAIFGQSMGALIAFGVARQLRRAKALTPLHLFASACRAPQLPDLDPPLHKLPEGEFITRLRAMNHGPDEIYDHPQFLELLLPTVRADCCLCESYAYRDEPPLDCPITVFGGLEDQRVTAEDLDAWKVQTVARFTRVMFPGGHLFLHHLESAVADCIVTELDQTLITAGG